MSDLISRQAAFIALNKRAENVSLKTRIGLLDAVRVIDELPSVEPERNVGKWHLLDECANEGWYCDQCHKKVFKADFSNTMRKYKFCPNCGAKMEVNG